MNLLKSMLWLFAILSTLAFGISSIIFWSEDNLAGFFLIIGVMCSFIYFDIKSDN